jgi:hypothetical protein
MPKSEENLKSEKYNREEFTLKISCSKTSQQGRLFRWLKDQGRTEKKTATTKAINAFYLVDALLETGTRSREDIQQIGQRCINDLAAQIARINQLTGLDVNIVSHNSKPKRDPVQSDQVDEDEEEDDPVLQMMEEHDDDVEVGKMTEEQWKEWEQSM